jgi:serine/threonine-protein kinase
MRIVSLIAWAGRWYRAPSNRERRGKWSVRQDRTRQSTIEDALAAEIERFRTISFGIWTACCVVGLAASLVVTAFISPVLGVALGVTCVAYLAVWLPVFWIHTRGRQSREILAIADVLEASSPWAVIAVLTVAEGPGYALASWLPPSLFMLVLFTHTLQLRKWSPLIIGLTGALAFPVLYLLAMRPELPGWMAESAAFGAGVQMMRTIWILLGGVMALVVARVARAAFVRAQLRARAQEIFGKYRLIRRLARGGMGEVYEASYSSEGGFERRVAIKRIHPHLAEDERFVRFFHREAEICARLAHPNVVQVFDFGRVDGGYYLAMEFVDGMTLAELINRARVHGVEIPEPVVRAILRGLISGLQHAHEGVLGPNGDPLRIVHRDLCPHNILLSRNGEVKISDFGVACALEDAAPEHMSVIAGHAAYMAPEMIRGESVDERSDIFALGVVAWEILANRRLFARASQHETLDALMNSVVSSARAHADPAWDALIGRALARNPEARFQSMRAVSTALDAIRITDYEHDARAIARFLERMCVPPNDADTALDTAIPLHTLDTSTLELIEPSFISSR